MNQIIQKGLQYLHDSQKSDGSFEALASQDKDSFVGAQSHPCIFVTSLISCSLLSIEEAHKIQSKSRSYLLSQKGSNLTWNYWEKYSDHFSSYPLPNDLDDTACCLATLWQSGEYSGKEIAMLAKGLIRAEIKEGGPYRTWVVPKSVKGWQDVDVAVNANIGFLLNEIRVQAKGLTEFIERAIVSGELSSPYYLGEAPSLYFISRWYKGGQAPVLRARVEVEGRKSLESGNPLMLALMLSSGVRVGASRELLKSIFDELTSLRAAGHWEAASMLPYVKDSRQLYVGAPEMTTAFAIEGIKEFYESSTYRSRSHQFRLAKHDDPNINDDLKEAEEAISSSATAEEITRMPFLVARALGLSAPEYAPKLHRLSLGTVYGWIAYTIYDDFIDDEGRPRKLGSANVCMRRSISCFTEAISDPIYRDYVREVFDEMDSANTWEVVNTRADLTGNIMHFWTLPNYGSLEKLYQRSFGHALAAMGVLVLSGQPMHGRDGLALQKFFRHMLIARQLCDDAHDWEEDLRSGRITAVVCQLIQDYGASKEIDMGRELEDLRKVFWSSTIDKLSSLIEDHCNLAREELERCESIVKPEPILAMLKPLERSARSAIGQRNKTRDFIFEF